MTRTLAICIAAMFLGACSQSPSERTATYERVSSGMDSPVIKFTSPTNKKTLQTWEGKTITVTAQLASPNQADIEAGIYTVRWYDTSMTPLGEQQSLEPTYKVE